MKKLVKVVFLLMVALSCIVSSHAYAISLVSFADYDFSQLNYDNRIRISSDSSDADFESASLIDSNTDGVVDYLEENSFVALGSDATLYLGNKHNSYDIARSLLFIGIDGGFESFNVNGINVSSDNVSLIGNSEVYFKDSALIDYLDSVALFELDQKIEDRNPNDSPIGENNLIEITINNLISSDQDLRMYCGAYGFIASGTMNSYTPHNSAVLFVPSLDNANEEGNANQENPVPEPTTLLTFGTSLLFLFMKGRRVV
ncbi:PEP-CTERM sorting domain-containing protein [Candidatus Omnitrophota bacterium]